MRISKPGQPGFVPLGKVSLTFDSNVSLSCDGESQSFPVSSAILGV